LSISPFFINISYELFPNRIGKKEPAEGLEPTTC
jgi:hypothetical protein